MSARESYPRALSGFYLEAAEDVHAMWNEIDQLRAANDALVNQLTLERQNREREIEHRVMEAGLKAGRKAVADEMVDRKGEPLVVTRLRQDGTDGSWAGD